jgi:protein-disulfide isomerase
MPAFIRSRFAILFLVLAGAWLAAAQAKPLPKSPAGGNWNATVRATPTGSHVLGNPDAKVKLTEYISYTCPHCAHFTADAENTLRFGFVAPGKGSIEVVPYLRDPEDLAASLLAGCVPPSRFWQIHAMLLLRQDKWLGQYGNVTPAQRARWTDSDRAVAMRAIAGDLHLYDIAESFGLSRSAADRCLSDKAMMDKLSQGTAAAAQAGVDATPSFAIDGQVLAGTHSWDLLQPQLEARMP